MGQKGRCPREGFCTLVENNPKETTDIDLKCSLACGELKNVLMQEKGKYELSWSET